MQFPQQPPYYPPPPPQQSSGNGWIIAIFVTLGAIVLIGGILAVLAIYGVRRYLSAAKSAEARNSLSQIALEASAAYDSTGVDPVTFAPTYRQCPSASVPVPSSERAVSGKKYMSAPGEWDVDAATNAGFSCLKFEMFEPQYYQYNYTATGTGAKVGDSFRAEARGDLDGDGVYSRFSMGGNVSSVGVMIIDSSIKETDPEE